MLTHAYPQIKGLDSLRAIKFTQSMIWFGDTSKQVSSGLPILRYSQCLRGSSRWGVDLESQPRRPWLWPKGQPWHRGCSTPGKRPPKNQSHGKRMPRMPRMPKCRRLPTSLGKKKSGKNSHKLAVGKATAKTTRTSRGDSSMLSMLSMLSMAKAGKNHKSGQENTQRSGQENTQRSGHRHPPVGGGTRSLRIRIRTGARGSS